MDVHCRILRKNHAVVLPVSALYFDTETGSKPTETGTIHHMRLGWTCHVEYAPSGKAKKEHWMEWYRKKRMCEWIEKAVHEKTVLWVFAHNAFFDLQCSGFFDYFTEAGWVLQFVYEAGLTYILVIRKGKKTIKVVSTTNYFQCSLAKIGKMVGLEKLDVDFGEATRHQLSTYCRRDVEIVRLAMEQYFSFIRRLDLGSFSMTIPSQAMRAFRHRFMNEKVYIHTEEKVQQLEQDSYFGGRTECFTIGEIRDGPFVTLDVNSMYPTVMATEKVPVQLIDHLDQPDIRWLEDALKELCVVSRVVLETDQPLYAIHHNQRVCFPVGRFATVLGTAGLREAMKRGHIVALGETAAYRGAVLFKSYVDALYPLKAQYRAAGEDVWLYLIKNLLTNLYGKWAQRAPVTDEEAVKEPSGYRREEVLDLVTGKMWIEYQLMNKRITIQEDAPGKNSFCSISAHITEAARMKLWRLIEVAGLEHVLYCDTDSIKVRERDVHNLDSFIDADQLGALKVEKVSDSFTIWGLKAYCEDGIRKIKGIPRKAVAESLHGYIYDHFLKQASHMRRQQITGMISETMHKRLNLVYQKGHVGPDGKVTPYHFGPLDPASTQLVEPSAYAPRFELQ